MPIFQIMLLAFLVVPLIEIYVLIQVGGVIGAIPTVLAVVGTAVLGATLIRAQGLATFGRMRASLERGDIPAVEMLEAACLVVAGALLMTPGFVTDAVGFALLIPPLRRTAILAALERGVIRSVGPHRPHPSATRHGPRAPNAGTRPERGEGKVIEGEYRRED